MFYELHWTIDPKEDLILVENLAKNLNIKFSELLMRDKVTGEKISDIMLTKVLNCKSMLHAKDFMKLMSSKIRSNNLEIIREKIETQPDNDEERALYFEIHVNVHLERGTLKYIKFVESRKIFNFSISENPKKSINEFCVIMATFRCSNINQIKRTKFEFLEFLERNEILSEKVIIEKAIYDTNAERDLLWM